MKFNSIVRKSYVSPKFTSDQFQSKLLVGISTMKDPSGAILDQSGGAWIKAGGRFAMGYEGSPGKKSGPQLEQCL